MPRLHEDHSRLTGSELKEFSELFLDTYGRQGLEILLRTHLGKQLDRITLADNLEGIVFDVIEDAEKRSYSAELLQAARVERQSDVGWLRFAQQFDLEPSFVTPESVVRAANPELDPDLWLSDAMARLGQICRIEMAGQGAIGTGFLVGPDLVLTNEHVVRPVIEGEVQPRHVKLRFDQRVRTQIAASPTVALHQDWLVDVSPNGVYPFTSAPASHLDYALLHTKTQPGHHIVDRDKELSRGWIDPTLPAGVLDADTPLFVMGHPRGDALKLTLDTQSVISVNETRTRLRYRTNTEGGSSGSPCFDVNWQLVALHHAGDGAQPPRYNEGIPIETIVDAWAGKAEGDELPAPQRALLRKVVDQEWAE